jgi:hypothetical protein
MSKVEDRFRFEDEPTDDDANHEWSIIRAPAEGILTLVVVSAQFRGARTHYFRGRTGPCAKTGCEACLAHQISRWNGYLLAVVSGSQEHVILEFTPPARLPLKRLLEDMPTLRGQTLVVSRTSKKTNGKVNIISKGMHPNAHKLPPEVPIIPLLCRIWGVDSDALLPFAEFSEYDKRGDNDNGDGSKLTGPDLSDSERFSPVLNSHGDREAVSKILKATAGALNGRGKTK